MSQGELRRVQAGGIGIAYVESGRGEPLVLLHGGEGGRGQFDVFTPLLGPGIRAISYDQRDTGATVNGAEPYDMTALAADCVALLAALRLDRVHVFGASYGGRIALRLALHHPGRVASLTLAGATSSQALTEPIVAQVAGLGPAERERFLLDLLLSPAAQRADPGLVAAFRRSVPARSPEAQARRAAAALAHDCTELLPAISAPTLVLHGADDPLIRTEVAASMAERIPDARLEVLPGVRHGITFEGRRPAAALLRAFIREHAIGPHT